MLTKPLEGPIKIDEQAEAQKLDSEPHFSMLFERGEVSLTLWAPRAVDTQKPHDRDEIYIISSGEGVFCRGRESVEFKAGDALFVPAGIEHRFERFSANFRTWVVFYGATRKSDGEKNVTSEKAT